MFWVGFGVGFGACGIAFAIWILAGITHRPKS